MRFLKRMLCLFGAAVFLAGCSSGTGRVKIKETNSLNVITTNVNQNIDSVTLYYDIGNRMGQIAAQETFKDIAMAVSSVSKEIASSYNSNDAAADKDRDDNKSDGDIVYNIKLSNSNGSTESDDATLTSYILGETEYTNEKSMVLNESLANINKDGLTVVVTDLASQIDGDYVSVADNMVKSVLKNDLAVAYICVYDYVKNPSNIPYFIVVIGNNDVVSEFVTDFKNDRTVQEISNNKDTLFESNTTDVINYEIFANKCGINNIIYNNIEFVEDGIVYKKKDNALTNEDPVTEYETVIDEGGSFTEVNENFNSSNYLDKDKGIEGTVNFNPLLTNADKDADKLVKYSMEDSRDANGNRISADNIKYLAVEPLVSSNSNDIAGKLKMVIPFDIINGVKLSLLECDVSTEIYYVETNDKNEGEFKKFEGKTDIDTSIAKGVENVQGKWRIDDHNKSLTFNIAIPHLNSLFEKINPDSPLIKLNVMFNHYKTKEYLPMWVLDLSSGEKPEGVRVNNLHKFFDYIYDYQNKEDKATNGFTLYIKNPAVTTERAARSEK